jgi:hypothetical protein
MRKLLLSLFCLLLMSGLVFAAEVTLVKFDKDTKEVTVKDGDKESTYKLTENTKITFIDQNGKSSEGTQEAAAKVLGKDKAKGKLKFEISTDKNTVTELKLKAKIIKT